MLFPINSSIFLIDNFISVHMQCYLHVVEQLLVKVLFINICMNSSIFAKFSGLSLLYLMRKNTVYNTYAENTCTIKN